MKTIFIIRLQIVLLICTSSLFVDAQTKMLRYYYQKKDGHNIDEKTEAFLILKQNGVYFFNIETETHKVFYKTGKREIYKDKIGYGPYKFKRNRDTIKVGVSLNNKWIYQDLVLSYKLCK